MMQYKNYTGIVAVDEEAGVIRGRVADLKDVITFQGTTVEEARRAFRDSVDDYLAFCAERGEAPERPFRGKLLVRVKSSTHRRLLLMAERRGISLNRLIASRLDRIARSAEVLGPAGRVGPRAEEAGSEVDNAGVRPTKMAAPGAPKKAKAAGKKPKSPGG